MTRSFLLVALVLLASLTLSLPAAGCTNQNAEAQTALDSASVHLAEDNNLYERQMEEAAAWREEYIATLEAPNFGEGMAETSSLLDEIDETIEARLVELNAAKTDLESIAGMDADSTYNESAQLLSDIVEGEIAYCLKHQEYVAGARELLESGYPPDETQLGRLEALRLELSELADAIDAKYEAAATYLNSPQQ